MSLRDMHFHYIIIPVGYFMSTVLTVLAVQAVGSSNVGAQLPLLWL